MFPRTGIPLPYFAAGDFFLLSGERFVVFFGVLLCAVGMEERDGQKVSGIGEVDGGEVGSDGADADAADFRDLFLGHAWSGVGEPDRLPPDRLSGGEVAESARAAVGEGEGGHEWGRVVAGWENSGL